MSETYAESAAVDLVVGIAEGLREEFGVGIDAHPGGEGTEAGSINRAFRAAAHRIFKAIMPPKADVPSAVSRALRRAARRHLEESGIPEGPADALVASEPALGDAWLAYVALAPASVIEDLAPPT